MNCIPIYENPDEEEDDNEENEEGSDEENLSMN